MCAAVYGLQFLLPGGPWVKLPLQIAAGAAIYLLLARLFRMESFFYLLSAFKSRAGRQA